MKKLYILLLIVAFSFTLQAQHNVIYSQYFFSGMLINPAYAGSKKALDITGLYRSQWTGIEGAPCNISLSAHAPITNTKMAAGLLYLNNSFGLTTENKISATYSWTSRLGSGELSFGAQAGLVAIRHNWAAAQTTQAEDPVFAGNMQKSKAAEFGAGTYYSNARFFAGLSSPALYRTEKGYSLSDSPVMFYAGGLLNLNEDLRLKPAVLVKYLSNSPVETDLTATVYWKEVIGVGLGYRTNDAVYAFFDLQLNEQAHLGYCYDYTVSALRSHSNGSHEVMLRYLFSYKVKSKSPRFF